MKNYYEELEVSKNASDEVISRAYKVLAKKYHPDTTTEDKQIAEERFKKISEAYEVLSNKQKREEYDKTLPAEIDSDRYNKILQDNKRLSGELLRVKSELDSIRLSNTPNSVIQNANNYTANYQNSNYNTNNYTNTEPRQYRKYTFLDMLKFKLNEFFKKIIAIFLTICIILGTLGILYAIPSTRSFLINDLHIDILFKLFK